VFPPLCHLVVVVFIIALLNIALLKVNMRNSDININSRTTDMQCLSQLLFRNHALIFTLVMSHTVQKPLYLVLGKKIFNRLLLSVSNEELALIVEPHIRIIIHYIDFSVYIEIRE